MVSFLILRFLLRPAKEKEKRSFSGASQANHEAKLYFTRSSAFESRPMSSAKTKSTLLGNVCLLSQVRKIIAPSRSDVKRILVVSLALRPKNAPPEHFCRRYAMRPGFRIPSNAFRQKKKDTNGVLFLLAEGVGFEPTWAFTQTVFKKVRVRHG